ncbi:hypothetical protein SFC07_07205 [Corynebacterium callunae]|uniref:hypothetical protein n=1 Tax=Corynebacterium callunae TaxID=1721 RepID=UPI0039826E4B
MLKLQSRALILAAGMLAVLSGCGQTDDSAETPVTVTVTESPKSSDQPTPAPATTTVTSTISVEVPVTGYMVPRDAPVGDNVDLEVSRATVCINGDGFGTNVWAAGPHTSCELVSSTYEVLTANFNATEDDLRDFLPMSIWVYSPVTQVTYDMSCRNESAEVSVCRGANNAEVYFY